MTKKQLAEAVIAGRRLVVMELRKVETGTYAANAEKKTSASHYAKYTAISGDDSCEVMLFAERSATQPPVPLKFNRGALAAVEFSEYSRSKYGLRVRADLVELLTD